MTTPADVLATMLRSDATRPRLTFYDDAAGPTRGERIELSAKVLANWVSKAANALQEEHDAGPGTTVALLLPPHWRAVYWALATWSTGATLVVAPPGEEQHVAAAADVVVTEDPDLAATVGRGVLVTLTMLARSNPATPPGAMDEARELATYGDVFDPWQQAEPADPAVRAEAADTAYGNVVVTRDWGAAPRVRVVGGLQRVLSDTLAAWALDGSVVLVREPEGDQSARLASEGVTLDLA